MPSLCRDLYSRRTFLGQTLVAIPTLMNLTQHLAAEESKSPLKFIVGSCMFGTLKLPEVLPEVRRCGAESIDIWPRVHADHREQIDAIGVETFLEMLKSHQVSVGIVTRYDLGPFRLQSEIPFAKEVGAKMLIANLRGPKDLEGQELKKQIQSEVNRLKPELNHLGDAGLSLGIENHSGTLLASIDGIRYFADAIEHEKAGIALAPYHLPQDPEKIARLIQDLGPRLTHFYAWEHGDGAMSKLPKEQELKQLPGRGPLDFRPIIAALMEINYQGWTEVFMHPFPRGIPILPTAPEVTELINESRNYLNECASTTT